MITSLRLSILEIILLLLRACEPSQRILHQVWSNPYLKQRKGEKKSYPTTAGLIAITIGRVTVVICKILGQARSTVSARTLCRRAQTDVDVRPVTLQLSSIPYHYLLDLITSCR